MIVILEHIGEIQIEEGLELLNPKMQLMSVEYDLIENTFQLEVHFWESKYRFSRQFQGVNTDVNGLTVDVVMDFVTTHPILSQFGEIV
tara:strand:+ start:2533 stop:2796 length:264 start_codon:yes stop_codon:yes gene_type:complete